MHKVGTLISCSALNISGIGVVNDIKYRFVTLAIAIHISLIAKCSDSTLHVMYTIFSPIKNGIAIANASSGCDDIFRIIDIVLSKIKESGIVM